MVEALRRTAALGTTKVAQRLDGARAGFTASAREWQSRVDRRVESSLERLDSAARRWVADAESLGEWLSPARRSRRSQAP